MINKDININKLIFLLVILLASIYYFIGFEGLLFSDDYVYSFYAHQLSKGVLSASDDGIFFHRIGVYFPVAVMYYLGGVNDITTTLWPFLCFIGTAFLIYTFLYSIDKQAGLFGAIFWVLSFYPLYFSNKLFPDIILSFFSLSTLLLLFKRIEEKYWLWKGLGVALLFFFAFLVKETTVLIVPFFIYVFINDLINKRAYKFWMVALGSGLVLAVAYLIVYYTIFDDPFYRFKVIQEGHYISSGSYYDKPLNSLLARLTYEPFKFLLASELMILITFSLLGKIISSRSKVFNYWISCGCMVLGAFWVGSTSFTFYNPISLNPRMYLMLFPIWAIAGGLGIAALLHSKKNQLIYSALVFFALAFLVWIVIGLPKQSAIYGLIALLIFANIFLRRLEYGREHMVLLLMGVLCVHPIYSALFTSRTRSYFATKRIMKEIIPDLKGEATIITDPLIAAGYPYFFKFNPPTNIHFIKVNSIQRNGTDKGTCFALINKQNIEELGLYGISTPDFFKYPPSTWKLKSGEGDVLFYTIPACKLIKDF